MVSVRALNSSIKSLVRTVNRYAAQDKTFAQHLAQYGNIGGKITPKSLRRVGCIDKMYTPGGKLTPFGKWNMKNALELFGLPKKATLNELIGEGVKYETGVKDLKNLGDNFARIYLREAFNIVV